MWGRCHRSLFGVARGDGRRGSETDDETACLQHFSVCRQSSLWLRLSSDDGVHIEEIVEVNPPHS